MVYLHLADGFEEIEAVTVADVLRRANIEVKMVSIMGKKEVIGAHGIIITADLFYAEADYQTCEMIVLPGGMPGTTNLGAHQGLLTQLKCFDESNKWIAAICAAPMILGQKGLLKDRKATIYQGMENYLTGATVLKDAVVTDGNLITSRGPGTATSFALEIVKQLKDKETADTVKLGMMIYG